MKKTVLFLFVVAGFSSAAPTFTVIPAIGTGISSPSDAAYAVNALTALRTGSNTIGSGAALYTRLVAGSVDPGLLIDTSGLFNSWLGVASPNALFNSEFGNRLYFGLSIVDLSGTFSLSQLVYQDNFATYDPINFSPDPVYFNIGSVSYDGTTIIGIYFGENGVLGGGDDLIYSSGQDNTTLVNALYYRGLNVAFPLSPGGIGTNQERLSAAKNAIMSQPVTITATYCLSSVPGSVAGCTTSTTSAPSSVSVVPEPSTYILFGVGLTAFFCARRRT